MRDEWTLRWHLLQRNEVAFREVTHLGRVPGLSIPRGALCHRREALGPQLGGDLMVESCFNSHSPLSYILLLALQESLPFCLFSSTCHKACFKYFIQCFSSFNQVGFSGYAVCHMLEMEIEGAFHSYLERVSPPQAPALEGRVHRVHHFRSSPQALWSLQVPMSEFLRQPLIWKEGDPKYS